MNHLNNTLDDPALIDSIRRTQSSDDFAAALRQFLNRGSLQSGRRLPSMRKLQELSGLGLRHVSQALDTLVAEGRLVQRRGSGTFVAPGNSEVAARSKETLRIGVMPPAWDPRFSQHAAALFLTGVTQQAGIRHRIHLVSEGLARLEPTEFVNHIRSWGLDGVIWVKPPVSLPLTLVRLLDAAMPVVLVGRAYEELPTRAVMHDHDALGEVLVEYLVSKRRRKLLCMVGVRNDIYCRRPIESLRVSMEKRGMALPDDQVITVRLETAAKTYSLDLRHLVFDFLAKHPDFDAVFSMYPDQLATLAHIHETNVRRCPEDFIHIHYGQLNVGEGQVWPSFPSAFLEVSGINSGRQAVKELERMLGVESDPVNEDLAPKIVHDPYV